MKKKTRNLLADAVIRKSAELVAEDIRYWMAGEGSKYLDEDPGDIFLGTVSEYTLLVMEIARRQVAQLRREVRADGRR